MLAITNEELRSSPTDSSRASDIICTLYKASAHGGQTEVGKARFALAINQHIVLFEVMSTVGKA
jgi:hypothetical protein